MIYKFKFEVYTDKNELVSSRSEESGNLWWAFREFMVHVLNHTRIFDLR